MLDKGIQLSQQFHGFLETPLLWTVPKFFEYQQLDLPHSKNQVPDELELEVPRNLILGKRAEYFYRYFIEHFSTETIVAHNIQVFGEKRTMGELDFIIRNKVSQTVSHVELVYKFYLYDPSNPIELERWIGPNKKDRLANKLNRLKKQQFPLLYEQGTQAHLEKLGLSVNKILQKVCFKANLFIPLPLWGKNFPEINNRAIQGFWIPKSEFIQEQYGSYQFYTPKKPDWLVDPRHNSKWYSFSEMSRQLNTFLDEKRSPLVWMKKNNDTVCRFFVVWW